jgi:hypothetical protein
MYFGDFVRNVMQNRITNSIAVGCNPYSYEWDLVAKHLGAVGPNMIFGDYSAFDGCLNQQVLYAAFDVIESFYYNSTQEDRNVRMCLFEDVVNSRHIVSDSDGSFGYEWFGSNPSGNFLTTIINCVSNVLIIRYSFTSVYLDALLPKGYRPNTKEIEDAHKIVQSNIAVIVFGDDNGISVSDEYCDILNPIALSDKLSDIGFKYTNESKSGSNNSFRTIEQCSLLKRSFVRDKTLSRYICPLELEVILEMPYWSKSSNTTDMDLKTLETATLELSLHDEATFKKYAPRFREVAIDCYDADIDIDYRRCRTKCLNLEDHY